MKERPYVQGEANKILLAEVYGFVCSQCKRNVNPRLPFRIGRHTENFFCTRRCADMYRKEGSR